MNKNNRTVGVVCEYNPFHNGHEYQLKNIREKYGDDTAIVAVMSGNFTQRGEAAIFEKHTRAKAALMCGADLVIELPINFAVSSAERFAYGAVSILDALGCVDEINFGSECGDIKKLTLLSDIVESDEIKRLTSEIMTSGVTFAAARQSAVERLYDSETAMILKSPNNTLGIEYIKAAKKLGSKMSFSTVERSGVSHDSHIAVENMASASFIRDNILKNGIDSIEKYVPQKAFLLYKEDVELKKAPHDIKYTERGVLDRLRRLKADDWEKVPDVSEGLHNRIYDVIRKSASLDDIFFQIKTKRYTLARIRRIILLGYLGVYSEESLREAEYIRVLGMNRRGMAVLRAAKKTASIPVGTSLADLEKLSDKAARFAHSESCSTDLYMLMCEKIFPCSADYTIPVVIIKD